MKEFYTFKLTTMEAFMAMDNAMKVVRDVDFETDSKINESTAKAWLTPKQVNAVINELYNHRGITVMQGANQRNTIFVCFSIKTVDKLK